MLPPPRTLRRRHRVARRRRPPRRHGEERLRRKRLRRTRPLHPESRPTARAGYSSPPPFPRPPHDLRAWRGSTGNLLASCRPRKSVAPTNNRDKPSAGPAARIILLIRLRTGSIGEFHLDAERQPTNASAYIFGRTRELALDRLSALLEVL